MVDDVGEILRSGEILDIYLFLSIGAFLVHSPMAEYFRWRQTSSIEYSPKNTGH